MTYPNVTFQENNFTSSYGDLNESAQICTLGQTAL